MFGGGSLMSLGASAHQLGGSSQLSQMSQQDKQARKMYVGNIPPNVTEVSEELAKKIDGL
jgi:hypothetical protein